MTAARPDLRRLVAALEAPEVRAFGGDAVAELRAHFTEAGIVTAAEPVLIGRGGHPLGRVRPFGSVVLYLPPPFPPLRHRLLELDPTGRVTLVIRRGPSAELQAAWVRNVDGTPLGILPGGAEHPLWGSSDRIVRMGPEGEVLSVCGAADWGAIGTIPPLADPTRLPPGAGTSILNVLASLAADQGAGRLRYRGPYPTEQLFWALLESFRFDPGTPEPLRTFTEGAEAALVAGQAREVALDWTAAPHERRVEGEAAEAVTVQLREGVEKVYWEGRFYYRPKWQGLERREHRVVRLVTGPDGHVRFVASIRALGRTVEDHLILDADGALLESVPGRPPAVEAPDTPVPELWAEALGALLPLEATPLLLTAIATVWPAFRPVWGDVPRDLVATSGTTIRLSRRLAEAYLAKLVAQPVPARRALARELVREVLGLVGPPVRRAAAAWLEAEPAARQEAHLAAAARLDRATAAARAAEPLGRLLSALEAGDGLPPEPP